MDTEGDKLDTVTLTDSAGPLSRDVPSSSIAITNTHVYQVQQESSSKKRLGGSSRGPYILLTTAQKYSIGRKVAENGITAMQRYARLTLLF